MNKLITINNGGYPFVLDDLRFVDESVRESFKNIFRPFGGSTYSNGFLIDYSFFPGNYYAGTIPEMAVFMNNEIWTLPATTFPDTANGSFLWVVPDIAFTNSAPGSKVLQNGTTVQTYEIRRAKIVQTDDNASVPVGYPGGFVAFQYEYPNNQPGQPTNWWDEQGWTVFQQATLRWLQNENSGLNYTNLFAQTLSSQIGQNSVDISANTSSINAINAGWAIKTANQLRSKMYLNSYDVGASTEWVNISTQSNWGQLDQTSYLKYKQIGKTMFFDIKILGLIFPYGNEFNTSHLWIDMSPTTGLISTTGIKDFSSVLTAYENNMQSQGNSVARIRKETLTTTDGIGLHNKTGFSIQMFVNGKNNLASFNSEYFSTTINIDGTNVVRTTPSVSRSWIAPYGSRPTWNFMGQFVVELT
jgi:hypothetical protein